MLIYLSPHNISISAEQARIDAAPCPAMPHRANNPGRGAAARWGVSTPLGEQYSAFRLIHTPIQYRVPIAVILGMISQYPTNTHHPSYREHYRDTIQSNDYLCPSLSSPCQPTPSKFNNAHKCTSMDKHDQRCTVHVSTTRMLIHRP